MNPWWKRPEPRQKGGEEKSRSRKRKGGDTQEEEAASVRSIDVLAEAEELATREKSEKRRSEKRSDRGKKSASPPRRESSEKRGSEGESKKDSAGPKRRVRRRRSRRKSRGGDADQPKARTERASGEKKPAAARKSSERESPSKMALYLDVESLVAAEDSFDAAAILEHLKGRGKVLIQRCYADWRRHAELKDALHGASMELIDVPVHRGSRTGAEMKMVVDALEACYQRDGIDTFVLVSGRRELLPLVAKLREADRRIVGIGSRESSPELVEACDEFFYLEDLAGQDDSGSAGGSETRRRRRAASKPSDDSQGRESKRAKSASVAEADAESSAEQRPASKSRESGQDERRTPAARPAKDRPASQPKPDSLEDSILQAVATVEREGHDRLWSSLVQQAMRRWDPELNERRLGYDGFTELLEDAQRKGLLELAQDDRTGLAYVTSWRGRSD